MAEDRFIRDMVEGRVIFFQKSAAEHHISAASLDNTGAPSFRNMTPSRTARTRLLTKWIAGKLFPEADPAQVQLQYAQTLLYAIGREVGDKAVHSATCHCQDVMYLTMTDGQTFTAWFHHVDMDREAESRVLFTRGNVAFNDEAPEPERTFLQSVLKGRSFPVSAALLDNEDRLEKR